MNKILALVFVLFSAVAQAAPLSFSLYGVALPDLVRVVVDDVAGASLVVSSEVIEDRAPLNFVLKNTNVDAALDALKRVVTSRGFSLVKSGPVFYLQKAADIEEDVFVYLPKYRSVSYLADLIGGLLPKSAIVNQRAVAQPAPQEQRSAGTVAPGQMGQMAQNHGVDTGTNALSIIDKSDKDALVIKAPAVQIAQVQKLLGQVDRPVPEMLVKAVLVEVQTGGIEGSAVSFVAKLIASGIGSASISFAGGADEKNGIKVRVGGVDAIWSAISTDSRFKVVSAPQIRVKSGSSARFSVGADTPVLGSVSYQGNGQSVQSVIYKQSGVILDLRPEIRGELAELKIFQQLSSFAKTETGVNNSPTMLKRELSTTVVVGQNDVVLLGGLDEEKSLSTESGFFFLPTWAHSKGGERSRSEIVLMLYVERVQSPGESI